MLMTSHGYSRHSQCLSFKVRYHMHALPLIGERSPRRELEDVVMVAADLVHVLVREVCLLNVFAPLRDVNVERRAGGTELCEDAPKVHEQLGFLSNDYVPNRWRL